MLTTTNVLSMPIFSNFSVAAGQSGLGNRVTGTVILGWESPKDIYANYPPGSFVLTSLVSCKNDLDYAKACIHTAIAGGASCIAIKSIFYKTLPDDLLRFADDKHCPIVFFTDSLFEDIIYAVRSELATETLPAIHSEYVEKLLGADISDSYAIGLSRSINPFFHDNIICFFAPGEQTSRIGLSGKRSTSIVRYRKGALVIHSMESADAALDKDPKDILADIGIVAWSGCIGGSDRKPSPSELPAAIRESLIAAISGSLDSVKFRAFSESGIDRAIIPYAARHWADRYYSTFAEKLTEFDKCNHSNLMQTLIENLRNNGNTALTAESLFLHKNTVRYRLNKIKSLLGIEGREDADFQLAYFARLHRIRQYSYLLPNM